MLLAPHETGHGLPVYEAGTPVATGADLRSLRKSENPLHGQDRVLRLVSPYLDLETTQMLPPDTLEEFLDKTDEELSAVADACDADLIDYEWGLLPDPAGQHSDYYPPKPLDALIPADHVLVAEVEIIKNAFTLYTQLARDEYPRVYADVRASIDRYESKTAGWLLTDIWLPQFVGLEDESGGVALTLVDIDPKLELIN